MGFRTTNALSRPGLWMFPHHCKEVSVKSVAFELTEESMTEFLRGKKAYLRTKYMVFNSGDQWAVVQVEKTDAREILQPIRSVKVLSLPHETAFVDDRSLEVLSASRMGRLREIMHKRCVVVRGRAEHISFFIEEPALEVTLFDVVPPGPSKLAGLVEAVLETDLQDLHVRHKLVEVDLNDLARRSGSSVVMFPCKASGLKAGSRTLYLDETPELSRDELAGLTLVGCSLSARIFKAVYGVEPKLVNMCPQDLLVEKGISGPVLLKCCKVREGFEVKGRVAVVPWGARAPEVAGALRKLLG